MTMVQDEAWHSRGGAIVKVELAAFVAFLLSDEAAFITGASLPIDGGATAG